MSSAQQTVPASPDVSSRQYQQVAAAIDYIATHWQDQPSLAQVASQIGLSEYHFQRLFSQWAGVSPKQYLQFLTKEYAKAQLRERSVQEAALAAGLSGAGRLHDLLVKCVGMTPGDYRRQGSELVIRYGTGASPFGNCFIAWTDRGLCALHFFDNASDYPSLLAEHRQDWSAAQHLEDPQGAQHMTARVFAPLDSGSVNTQQPLQLLMRGSEFQLQVWQALLDVAPGEVVAYQQVATAIGKPAATRAVASVIARNRIGWLIPCHRVIRSSGDISQYRWGVVRKRAMLAREAAARLSG